jgi:hypothetical protein
MAKTYFAGTEEILEFLKKNDVLMDVIDEHKRISLVKTKVFNERKTYRHSAEKLMNSMIV